MKTTYNEILTRMKNAYFERCGEPVNDFSEVSARLEAVASELFSLECNTEYVLRQAFPQTATGKYLDFHASLRDISRKQASFASGELTFYVSEPAQNDIEIPSQVLCSKEGEPFLQYCTTESAVLSAGETEVSVTALAAKSGAEYNTKAETVTVMVNPPTGIDGVYNSTEFKNGMASEGDEALRQRILNSYSIPQSGFSFASIREAIMSFDEVVKCLITYSEGLITVFLRVKSGKKVSEIAPRVSQLFALDKLVNCNLSIIAASFVPFALNVEIKTNTTDSDRVVEAVKEEVESYLTGVGIEEDIVLDEIFYRLSKLEGISYCKVFSPNATNGIIICPRHSCLGLTDFKVNIYD